MSLHIELSHLSNYDSSSMHIDDRCILIISSLDCDLLTMCRHCKKHTIIKKIFQCGDFERTWHPQLYHGYGIYDVCCAFLLA